MAARDHLGEQFERRMIPIEEIGRMQSVNIYSSAPQFDETGNRTFPHGTTVDDWDRMYRARPDATAEYRDRDQNMAKNGFPMDKPLEVGIATGPRYTSVLFDGHHRYSAAKAAGITHVPVIAEESNSPRKHWGLK